MDDTDFLVALSNMRAGAEALGGLVETMKIAGLRAGFTGLWPSEVRHRDASKTMLMTEYSKGPLTLDCNLTLSENPEDGLSAAVGLMFFSNGSHTPRLTASYDPLVFRWDCELVPGGGDTPPWLAPFEAMIVQKDGSQAGKAVMRGEDIDLGAMIEAFAALLK